MDHFYHTDIFEENWSNYTNLYKLFVQILQNGSTFVEVGTWKGRSISFFAVEAINSNKNINCFCVDTWQGSKEHANDPYVINNTLYEKFLENTKPVSHYIKPIKKTSVDAASDFEDGSIDVVFIDANHEYDAVKEDIRAWLPKIKNGGIMAGHDYDWSGVNAAVHEMFGNISVRSAHSPECWIVQIKTP